MDSSHGPFHTESYSRNKEPLRSEKCVDVKKPENKPIHGLTGVLVDVSGSMSNTYSLDRTVSGNVERTHAIITTLNGIVKRESETHDHERCDHVFVSAFGLKDVNTCDLIQLLEYEEKGVHDRCDPSKLELVRKDSSYLRCNNIFEKLSFIWSYGMRTGYDNLSEFANEKNAPHVDRWVRKSLTEAEAGVLYTILSSRDDDDKLTQEFIEKLPGRWTSTALGMTSALSLGLLDAPDSTVKDSEAYKLAEKVIYRFANITLFLQKPEVQIPQVWPFLIY